MTEREKIISLARDCGLVGYYLKQDDFIIAFYRSAQADAFEKAAQVCEEKWRKEDSFDSHSNAKAIRKLGKEK